MCPDSLPRSSSSAFAMGRCVVSCVDFGSAAGTLFFNQDDFFCVFLRRLTRTAGVHACFVNHAPLFNHTSERIARYSLSQWACVIFSAVNVFCAKNSAEYDLSDMVMLHFYMFRSDRFDGYRLQGY